MIDSIKPVVYLPIARVAQEVADAEPGVDLSAAEVEVNKNTTKSSSCECFDNILIQVLLLVSLLNILVLLQNKCVLNAL